MLVIGGMFMITLVSTLYEYQGKQDGLLKFRRKGKKEWILVDKARFVEIADDGDTRSRIRLLSAKYSESDDI